MNKVEGPVLSLIERFESWSISIRIWISPTTNRLALRARISPVSSSATTVICNDLPTESVIVVVPVTENIAADV